MPGSQDIPQFLVFYHFPTLPIGTAYVELPVNFSEMKLTGSLQLESYSMKVSEEGVPLEEVCFEEILILFSF